MRTPLRKGWIFPCITGAVVLAAACFEPIYGVLRSGAGVVYTFVQNWPEDYYYYLHLMRQGYEGQLSVTSRMTPESYPSVFAVPFFAVLGFVGRIVPAGPGMLYLVARIAGGAALLICIWFWVRIIVPDGGKRLWVFLLVSTGTYLPVGPDGRFGIPGIVRDWSELDPLARLVFVPHHLWSKVLFVGLLALYVRITRKTDRPVRTDMLAAGIAVTVICMGFMSPVILVTFAAVVGVWVTGELLGSAIWRTVRGTRLLVILGVSLSAVGVVSWYHWRLAHSVFPWTTYGPPWEGNHLFLFEPLAYAISFGVLFPFAVAGAVRGYRRSSAVRLLVIWAASGWVFRFMLREFLPFSNTRYLAGYQWIPVGLLASVGITWLVQYAGTRRDAAFRILCASLLAAALPSWALSMRAAAVRIDASRYDPQVFAGSQVRGVLGYLATLAPPCTVAAPAWLSTMIPAFSSCRVVSGHRLMTFVNDIKVYEMNEFFYGTVPAGQKKARLRQYGVTHVVTLDGITGTDIMSLLAPAPVYSADGASVYRVAAE